MQPLNRRQLLQHSTLGLAAVGGGALTLHAEAAPTEATEDVHDYQAFLDSNGIPQVQPAGTYKPTHVDILGPFHLAGAPFRGKVTAPLEPGETMLIRGRIWGFDSRKPIANALLAIHASHPSEVVSATGYGCWQTRPVITSTRRSGLAPTGPAEVCDRHTSTTWSRQLAIKN